jgi:hypothetical protein
MRIKIGRSDYSGEDTSRNIAQLIFEITTKMMTANDVLELGMTSVDEVAPIIRDAH